MVDSDVNVPTWKQKLAAELQISRTPVREALLRLEQDGVLVTSSRGGFMLHRMSEGEIKELYQARAAIEGQAARILAVENDSEKNANGLSTRVMLRAGQILARNQPEALLESIDSMPELVHAVLHLLPLYLGLFLGMRHQVQQVVHQMPEP